MIRFCSIPLSGADSCQSGPPLLTGVAPYAGRIFLSRDAKAQRVLFQAFSARCAVEILPVKCYYFGEFSVKKNEL